MASMPQLVVLDAKARHYLDLKTSMIPARAMRKPKITTFYDANAYAIYVDGIPADCKLEYILDSYDNLKAWNYRISIGQSFNLSRFIWYWQIDDTHSFSHKHKVVRYNIVTMSLVCGAEDNIRYCDGTALDFAWAFLRAWINTLVKHDDFNEQEKFLQLWRSSGLDLMHFGRTQQQLMKHRLLALKEMALPILPFKMDEFLNANRKELDLDVVKKFGPAIALRWCLAQEDFGYQANADEIATNIDAELGQLGLDMEDRYDLTAIDWEWPPLRALMQDPVPQMPHPVPTPDARRFWYSPSKAIDLMGSEQEKAESMLRSLAL
jgi:hypothetical protein